LLLLLLLLLQGGVLVKWNVSEEENLNANNKDSTR
jgi:hypothetical protein